MRAGLTLTYQTIREERSQSRSERCHALPPRRRSNRALATPRWSRPLSIHTSATRRSETSRVDAARSICLIVDAPFESCRICWELDNVEPEKLDGTNNTLECSQIERLRDIAVSAERIALNNIIFSI
jgi:hypothetical protein